MRKYVDSPLPVDIALMARVGKLVLFRVGGEPAVTHAECQLAARVSSFQLDSALLGKACLVGVRKV